MSALCPDGHCTSCFKRVMCILCRRHVDVHRGGDSVSLMWTHVDRERVKSLIFYRTSYMDGPLPNNRLPCMPHTPTLTHTYTHLHPHPNTQIHIHLHIRPNQHTSTPTHICAHTDTRTHTNTYTQSTYTSTHIRTIYIHPQNYTYNDW